MAGENISANMLLPVPGVGVTDGPQYAIDLNACMSIIDQHDHSTGSGVPITPSGLNISSDLSFMSNNATALRSSRYTPQVSTLALPADVGAVYVKGVDLYFIDVNGNDVRMTQSGAVAGTPGAIANLVAPASAAYVSGSSTFVWQSDTLTPANLDAASIILRNLTASSNGLTLNPPAAMGSNFSITLPNLPVTNNFVTIDASGNMGAPVALDGLTTANLSPSANIVGTQLSASAGIEGFQLANGTITGANMGTNIDLPGAQVSANGRILVTSNTNTSTNIGIIRGTVNSSGVKIAGEGFTCSRLSTGIYSVIFSTPFDASDSPVIVVTPQVASTAAAVVSVSYTACQITVKDIPGNSFVDVTLNFMVMGLRA